MWFSASLCFRVSRFRLAFARFAALVLRFGCLVTWWMGRCTGSFMYNGPSTSIGRAAAGGQLMDKWGISG